MRGRIRGLRAIAAICISAAGISAAIAQPTPASSRHQVATFLASGQYDAALTQLNDLLQASPNDASLWTLQGVALDRVGRANDSLVSFNHALSLNHSYVPALEGAAQTAYLHHLPSAMDYVQHLLAVDPNNTVAHAMAGALAYDSHDCAHSVTQYQQAEDTVIRSKHALSEYSDCLLKTNRPSDAIDVLSRGLVIYPADHQLVYNLAVAQMADHVPAKAIETLTSIPAPEDSGFLNLLAEAYVETERPDDAFRTLNDAIRIAPDQVANYLDLAILCLERQKESMAVEAASAGIKNVKRSASLYLIRGVAYAQLGQYRDAENDFSEASAIEPHQAHGTIAMSLLYSDRNEIGKEKQLLQQQLKVTPKDAVTNYLLADLLIRQGASPGSPDFTRAKTYLATSLQSKPDSAEAQILMSKLPEDDGDTEGALEHLQAVLKIEPANRTALYREFILLQKMHRKAEAGEVLVRLRTTVEHELKKDGAGGQIQVDASASQAQ